MAHPDYVKERLIAELRLMIDKYEDSNTSPLLFTDSIKNILNKPMYKEDEEWTQKIKSMNT